MASRIRQHRVSATAKPHRVVATWDLVEELLYLIAGERFEGSDWRE